MIIEIVRVFLEMMESISILTLLTRLGPKIFRLTGAQETVQLRFAIEATAKDVSVSPRVREWLANWCSSPSFVSLVLSLKEGERLSEKDVVENFLLVVESPDRDRARDAAHRIINTFLLKLDSTVAGLGSEGLARHDKRSEVRHQEVLGGHQEILRAVQSLSQDRISTLPQLASTPDNGGKRIDSEQPFHLRLDEARKLIDGKRIGAAKSIIDGLVKDLAGHQLTDYLRFRIESNLGSCALFRDEIDTAKEHFSTAHQYQPENAKGLANLARIALISGEKQNALELSKKAIDRDASDAGVVAARILVLHDAGDKDGIEDFVTQVGDLATDPICGIVIGLHHYESSHYSAAESVLKSSLEGRDDLPEAWELLGRAISVPIQQDLRGSGAMPWKLDPNTIARLEEAEGTFSKALMALDETDLVRLKSTALFNRAVCRMALGKPEQAKVDCDAVLAADPTSEEALRLTANIHIVQDAHAEAAKCLEGLSEDRRSDPDVAVSLAMAYINSNRASQAVDLLEPLWARLRGEEKGEALDVGELLAAGYRRSGRDHDAERLVEELDAAYAGIPRAKAIVAEHQAALGNLDEAIRTLETSRDEVGDVEPITSLRLGDLYYRAERFDSAAEEYETVFSLDAEDPIRTRYVISLYNAGEWKKAFSLARELRERYGISKGLADVELFTNELIGDLSSAVVLLHEWIEQQPNEYHLRVWLATYYVRLDQKDGAQKQLESLRPRDLTGQPDLLLKVAQMVRFLELGSGLEFAYEAWRSAPDDPLAQVEYAGFVLSIEANSCPELAAPASVDVDCTVTLEGGSDVRHVTVVADPDPGRWPDYVSPGSVPGRKVLGKKKGEDIEWDTAVTFRVRDIRTKYMQAARQVLEEFPFAFPEHPALQKLEVPNKGDPKAIVATLAPHIEPRHAYVDRWLQMYRTQRTPLGSVASGTGLSLLDLWPVLSGESCANGR